MFSSELLHNHNHYKTVEQIEQKRFILKQHRSQNKHPMIVQLESLQKLCGMDQNLLVHDIPQL